MDYVSRNLWNALQESKSLVAAKPATKKKTITIHNQLQDLNVQLDAHVAIAQQHDHTVGDKPC